MTNPTTETGEKGIPVIGSSTDRTSEMQLLFADDVMPAIDWQAAVNAKIDKAVLEEREACAKVAEEKAQHWDSPRGYEREAIFQAVDAIRNRSAGK